MNFFLVAVGIVAGLGVVIAHIVTLATNVIYNEYRVANARRANITTRYQIARKKSRRQKSAKTSRARLTSAYRQ